ncbi:BAG family molecular chaperone regulator 2 [Sesamum angolense]|uniref:BAG family molecular chaperone regulator 2 n=1 Tax=Sesamum angolense TaxID=2727404 RepID=A0AAE1XDM9_9LAMI|nr:BAG family molecular chaperone regulator 2 [Sesamum angolense]
MIKLRAPKRFSRSSSSKLRGGGAAAANAGGDIKWELRPGGMLVQKREINQNDDDVMITIRVSTVSQWHDISVRPTSTFGELKMVLSVLTKLEAEEQRILFKGKEREDHEHLHMVGKRERQSPNVGGSGHQREEATRVGPNPRFPLSYY